MTDEIKSTKDKVVPARGDFGPLNLRPIKQVQGKHSLFVKDLINEVEALRATINPVLDWYDGDGRRTDVVVMLREAIEDLQRDRANNIKLEYYCRAIIAIVRDKGAYGNEVKWLGAIDGVLTELQKYMSPPPEESTS